MASGRCDHRRHGDDRGVCGPSDRPLSRARQGSPAARTAADIFRDHDAVAEEGWKIVAMLRLNPLVPFNLQNHLFGVTAIPFRHFVAATSAGIIPGTVLTFTGRARQGCGERRRRRRNVSRGFFGTGLLATVVVVVLVTRKAMAKLKAAGLDDRNP